MRGFGGVMCVLAVLAAVSGLIAAATSPAMIAGYVLVSSLASAIGLGAGGAMLMCLDDMRDALRELVVAARDDAAFRKAVWQRQTAPAPPPLPFQPIMAPTGENQSAIPLPTRLELQDRHGADLGAAVFQIMQDVARRGERITEAQAVAAARGETSGSR